MKVIVCGAGEVGRYVSAYFDATGDDVCLLERSPTVAAEAASRVGTRIRVLVGDGCAVDVLRKAGTLGADLVVAVTDDDEDNLVVGLLAKQEFGAASVVARVNNSRNEWLFTEMWGVDVSLAAPGLLNAMVGDSGLINRYVPLLMVRRFRTQVRELLLPLGAKAEGKRVSGLDLGRASIVAVLSDGAVNRETAYELRALDRVVLVSGSPSDDHDARQALIG